MDSNLIRNKIRIAKLLGPHPAVAKYMPKTCVFNKKNLRHMCHRFPMLYLKPSSGCQSYGIIRVLRNLSGYQIRSLYQSTSVSHHRALLQTLRPLTKGKRYIIQQGIDSVDDKGTHFDIRVHLLRINRRWQIGGVAARLAAPNGFVAGLHQGGRAIAFPYFMEHNLHYRTVVREVVKNRIVEASVKAAQIVSTIVPHKKEMAVDMGIDRNHHPWIFEVNYARPAIRLFQFADPNLYYHLISLRRKAR